MAGRQQKLSHNYNFRSGDVSKSWQAAGYQAETFSKKADLEMIFFPHRQFFTNNTELLEG